MYYPHPQGLHPQIIATANNILSMSADYLHMQSVNAYI